MPVNGLRIKPSFNSRPLKCAWDGEWPVPLEGMYVIEDLFFSFEVNLRLVILGLRGVDKAEDGEPPSATLEGPVPSTMPVMTFPSSLALREVVVICEGLAKPEPEPFGVEEGTELPVTVPSVRCNGRGVVPVLVEVPPAPLLEKPPRKDDGGVEVSFILAILVPSA